MPKHISARLCIESLFVISFLISSVPARSQNVVSYTIKDLGVLPRGTVSEGSAINKTGDVTGLADVSGQNHAFLWTPRTGMKDLGMPSIGNAVNDTNAVAGVFNVGGFNHAFAWTASKGFKDLGVLPGGNSSIATGITLGTPGIVVGYSNFNHKSAYHAFIWTGTMRDIGVPKICASSEQSLAYAINGSAQVTGEAPFGSQCANHAFIWTNGKFKDLGVPPKCSSSVGSAISNNGAVGGWCFTATGEQFAFLWTQKLGMRNLGTLPHGSKSTGLGVNDLDEVVGVGDCGTCRFGSHAFVWSPSGGMQDLNNLISSNSGWTLTIASAINNLGQITGTGSNAKGTHAYLLTPKGAR